MSPKKQRRMTFRAYPAFGGGRLCGTHYLRTAGQCAVLLQPERSGEPSRAAGPKLSHRWVGAEGQCRTRGGLEVRFAVTDGANSVPVVYRGELPDLFREGQGVVAVGARGADGVFVATQVLAKHDERYMPREVVDALKRAGRWKEGENQMGGTQ